jgi:threonine dehydrogenase-like Zn-dependent dehydrogenase
LSRQYLPDLIKIVWEGKIDPCKVFDLVLTVDQVEEGYPQWDERRAIKTLLQPPLA